MELIVITSPDKFKSEIPIVLDLFKSGLMTLHVRKTKFSTKKLAEYIDAIPKQFHNRLIIHSHHKLALKFKLKGVHFTKQHRKNKIKNVIRIMVLKLRRPELKYTRSFHQIETLLENRKKYHYVFLNPYFSKIDASKNSFDVNTNYLKQIIQKSVCPVYASGNVTLENYHLLQSMSIEGFSLSKSLWTDPEKASKLFLKIQEEIQEW